jgi:hypothetical protein
MLANPKRIEEAISALEIDGMRKLEEAEKQEIVDLIDNDPVTVALQDEIEDKESLKTLIEGSALTVCAGSASMADANKKWRPCEHNHQDSWWLGKAKGRGEVWGEYDHTQAYHDMAQILVLAKLFLTEAQLATALPTFVHCLVSGFKATENQLVDQKVSGQRIFMRCEDCHKTFTSIGHGRNRELVWADLFPDIEAPDYW